MAATADWRSFWDSDHSIYVNDRHKDVHYRAIAEQIAAFVPGPSARVLDFGCGDSLHADMVAAVTAEVERRARSFPQGTVTVAAIDLSGSLVLLSLPAWPDEEAARRRSMKRPATSRNPQDRYRRVHSRDRRRWPFGNIRAPA